jgi:hypothetical protein
MIFKLQVVLGAIKCAKLIRVDTKFATNQTIKNISAVLGFFQNSFCFRLSSVCFHSTFIQIEN